ncbi:MAG TPA: carboxypeptidase-like regulatory domain-containing protein [Candidatus Binataceae bacterium]|nr:carboxypeptidase-like regulatory domain-containing protein [Candidatus Binataceae bacterium]
MTIKLSAKQAIGALAAALALGAAPLAPTADAADVPAQMASPTAATSTAAQASREPVPSPSAQVSGVLTDPHDRPLANMEINFQGRVDPDIFTVRTGTDGSFSTVLPPGIYDLRDAHGAIIASDVSVGPNGGSIGRVQTPAPLAPTRLFDRQALSRVIVKNPAPSGAYVPAAGETHAPIKAATVVNPPVQGATGGRAMAPAQVVPMGIEQQIQIPPGADTTIAMPGAAEETMPPPSSEPAPPSTEGGKSRPPRLHRPSGAY